MLRNAKLIMDCLHEDSIMKFVIKIKMCIYLVLDEDSYLIARKKGFDGL